LSAKHIKPERIRRVVVRGANWVGDAVMTVPALRALRRVLPDARITLATRAWAAGLFADADFVDDILAFNRTTPLRDVMSQSRAWRSRGFDLALLLPNSFESALAARAAGVPFRVGYAGDARGWLLTHAVARPAWKAARHEIFYYLNLVAELENLLHGTRSAAQLEPEFALTVPPERQAAARELFIPPPSSLLPLIAFCPGSTNSRAKRWPAENYARLGDMLAEKCGATILLIGSADERDVSEMVAAQMRHTPVNLTGRTKLAESVALLSLADAFVTNDTGPAHIAAALGVKTYVIFGPTDPATTRPWGENVTVLREPPDCAPCMLRDCPIDHRCMTAITPEMVAAQMNYG
jgi:heptosyltransferase-2